MKNVKSAVAEATINATINTERGESTMRNTPATTTTVTSTIEYKDGKFHLDIIEVPDITRDEEKMLRVSKTRKAEGERVATLSSEINLFNADETIFAWDFEEKLWSELSEHDHELWTEIAGACGEEDALDVILEEEYDTDSDPDTWATSKGYVDDFDGYSFDYAIDTYSKNRNAIYVRPEGDDYVIAGYHIVFTGFGIRSNPSERFINSYHRVYGSNDTMVHVSEDMVDNIVDRLDLPEPLYTTIYSKSCFNEFCLDILGDNFEVIYVEPEESEEELEVKEDFLIEMAPESCNSLMCEVNADEIDCNIRTLYDMGKIAFTDGFSGGGCYVYDSEGNIVEYRIPVFRIAEYEINNTKYTAFEVDANFQLWYYEHNGFIGNQYGYWHVPMDATKAVFEEFRRIFG